LVTRLAYKGPEVIGAELRKSIPGEGATLEVLDAGCGTGLCGRAIRSRCRRLIGVDLAEKMIEQARKRGCYDELETSELCEFMDARPEVFDAIVSADVLIYFGELHRPIASANRALRIDGILIFTLEALQAEGNEPYRLLASGRYAHRESYVRDVI